MTFASFSCPFVNRTLSQFPGFSESADTLHSIIVARRITWQSIVSRCMSISIVEYSSALFSEKKGLADISTIIKNSVTFLKENGKLLLEHGFDQKDSINEMANQNDYSDVSFLKDLNGKWRVACLTK